MTTTQQTIVPVESIAHSILLMRGQKVILDADLARLYGVTTQRLNQQVRRNLDRFPEDFMFQLTREETDSLKLHFATSKAGRGGRRTLPLAFTEHGALMAASVLSTPRAVEVSIYVVRAFVRLRELLGTHAELAETLEELEKRLESRLDTHDEQIAVLMETIRQLMAPPDTPQRQIGFRTEDQNRKPATA